jgi:hypothetical protein
MLPFDEINPFRQSSDKQWEQLNCHKVRVQNVMPLREHSDRNLLNKLNFFQQLIH